MSNQIIHSDLIAKMKYVVGAYISDKTGTVVRIKDYTQDQLDHAYKSAVAFYGDVLPCPDNGRYQDYI